MLIKFKIMSKYCEYCFELQKNCICEWYTCSGCGVKLSSWGNTYEYRGSYSCESCFEKVQQQREEERENIIQEERHKTDRFKGLDMSDSIIGKANREILKKDIEVASKESKRLRDYEGR